MFVFLSKLLPIFVYPLGIACIILLLALLLQRDRAWRNRLVLIALLILWVASTRWVSYSLARSLEWRYLPIANIPKADVIVVLGGGTEAAEPPRPSVELNGAADRIFYAAKLYKEGKAAHILLSGGNVAFLGEVVSTPAQQMAEVMNALGVPADALWLDNQSQNTYENALYSHKILQEKGINRILLVTSAVHMPRSVAVFQKQGFEVIPAPTDFAITAASWNGLTSMNITDQVFALLPNSSSLSLTTNIMKEYLGMLVYRIQGWM